MRIIKDLESEGYIQRRREGRINHYVVDSQAPLRRQEKRDGIADELLNVLSKDIDEVTSQS